MVAIRKWWPAAALVSAAGCATVKPDAKIREAGALVEERLGQSPAWTVPWETAVPDGLAGGVLSLDDAVALALRNNRALRADLEMIGQASADLVQAGLMQNPLLSFMVMFPDGGGRAMLRGNGLPMQPLQDLWLIPARKRVAAAELQAAVLRVADRAIETATAVKAAYARLRYSQRAIELIRDNIALVEQSIRIVGARQAAGQVTQVAVSLTRIRAHRLRAELLTMEGERRSLQHELLLLIGFAGASDDWSVTPIHEINDRLTDLEDEQALFALGAAQRLDLRAAEWSLQAAERRIVEMQRAGWPDLALGLGFERAGAPRSSGVSVPARAANAAAQGLVDAAFGKEPALEPPMVTPFVAQAREMKYTLGPMLELELPIFDQNQAQVARAAHEFSQKLAEYEARAQEITRAIRTALVQRRQALEQVRFYRADVLPEVERTLALAQETFIAGQEGLTVYFEAQEDLIMTRLKTLEFLREYLLGGVELERAVGGRLAPPEPATRPAPPRGDPSATVAPQETRQGVNP